MSWDIYYRIAAGEAAILRCFGAEDALSLPDTIEGCPVTALGSRCFAAPLPSEQGAPDALHFIAGEPPAPAGRYHDALKRLRLPASLRCLEDRCFAGCRSLKRLELPAGITELGEHVFDGCGSLTHLELPDGIQHLPAHTFAECRALERVRLPETVETLGRCCFYNCTHLRELNLPDSVETIGDRMLMNCFSLQKLSFRMGLNAGALLAEIEGAIRVTARDAEGSVTMLLPEYSYEYDELIPARQFRAVTHGSGGLYRGCFSDRDIDFPLYDTYFYECKRDDPPELAAEVAFDRLRWPRQLRPGPEREYWAYLLAHPVLVAKLLLKNNDLDGLSFLLSSGKLEKSQRDVLLEEAQRAGSVRFVSRLLESAGEAGVPFGADKSFDL